MAAKSKFTPAKRAAVLTAIRTGVTLDRSAELAGLGRATVWRWLHRGQQDERERRSTEFADFVAEYRTAQAEADAGLERTLYGIATSGDDWRATAFVLSKRHPEMYGLKAREQEVQVLISDLLDAVRRRVSSEAYAELIAAVAELDPSVIDDDPLEGVLRIGP